MFTPSRDVSTGPLLDGLLTAQRRDEEATSHPLLAEYARRVVALSRRLGNPVLWPVGPAAERLAGAAVLAGEGAVRVRGWSGAPAARVLLLATVATSPIELVGAGSHARALNAASVHACAIDVEGIETVDKGAFDSFTALGDVPQLSSRAQPAPHPGSGRTRAAA